MTKLKISFSKPTSYLCPSMMKSIIHSKQRFLWSIFGQINGILQLLLRYRHNEVNDYDSIFSSLSATWAFRMQRTLFIQCLQPYVIREAMLNSVTFMILDSHKKIRTLFADIVSKVQSHHSFAAASTNEKKIQFEKQTSALSGRRR